MRGTKFVIPRSSRGGDFQSVQQILGRIMKKRGGMAKDIERYKFVTHWKEIVGEQIALRTRPECIRNSALVVRVVDSTWAQELSFYKEVILKRLTKYLAGHQRVNDVQFYVGGEKGLGSEMR